jgi:hypothetical protein
MGIEPHPAHRSRRNASSSLCPICPSQESTCASHNVAAGHSCRGHLRVSDAGGWRRSYRSGRASAVAEGTPFPEGPPESSVGGFPGWHLSSSACAGLLPGSPAGPGASSTASLRATERETVGTAVAAETGRTTTIPWLWPCSIVLGNLQFRKTGSVPQKNAERSSEASMRRSRTAMFASIGARHPPQLARGQEKDEECRSERGDARRRTRTHTGPLTHPLLGCQ